MLNLFFVLVMCSIISWLAVRFSLPVKSLCPMATVIFAKVIARLTLKLVYLSSVTFQQISAVDMKTVELHYSLIVYSAYYSYTTQTYA